MTPAERDERTGSDEDVHCLLPHMGYACGENILSTKGRFEMGAYHYERITCAGCLTYSRDYLLAISRWMQGRGEHPDELPAPEHHAVAVGDQMDLFEVTV